MRLPICLLFFFYSLGLFAQVDFDKQQIQQRIEPVGKVLIEEETGNTKANTEQQPVVAAAVKSPGQATYEQYCVVCHRDGLAGAPKLENKDDWQPRMSAKKLDGLLASVKNGLNAMPAKGTCTDCSDEDLTLAIEYMLPKK